MGGWVPTAINSRQVLNCILGLTDAYFPAVSQEHLSSHCGEDRLPYSVASLHQGTVPSTYRPLKSHRMEAPVKKQRLGLRRRWAFPTAPRRLRMFISRDTAFLGTQLNSAGNSLSSRYRVLLERLFASCCLGNPTLLSFNLILIWKEWRGGGKPHSGSIINSWAYIKLGWK